MSFYLHCKVLYSYSFWGLYQSYNDKIDIKELSKRDMIRYCFGNETMKNQPESGKCDFSFDSLPSQRIC